MSSSSSVALNLVREEAPSGDPLNYMMHPFLWELAVARRLTGDPDGYPDEMTAPYFLKSPVHKMLSIGIGIGHWEEWYVQTGCVGSVVAFEASSHAVEEMKKRLSENGLISKFEFHNENILDANLENGAFDVIIINAGALHFMNVKETFALAHRLLKPGGLLFYDEYIGPDHRMYEEEVLALTDEINNCLDRSYRLDFMRKGKVRERIPRATLKAMLAKPPSEGAETSQILPLTYKYFDIVSRLDYGGAILEPFFRGILTNFNFDDPKDQTIGRLIILIEDLLNRFGYTPHYHSKVVCRRRDRPRETLTPEQAQRINYSDWDEKCLGS
jgi:ubiquinone/menaquinone biosynthesis C-methylase UbiE